MNRRGARRGNPGAGQGLIEYALILGLIALLVIALFMFISEDLAGSNTGMAATLNSKPGEGSAAVSALMY